MKQEQSKERICLFKGCRNRLNNRQKKFCCRKHGDRYRYIKDAKGKKKYSNEYYKKNKGRIKERNKKYFKEWYRKNREKHLENQKKYNKKRWRQYKNGNKG